MQMHPKEETWQKTEEMEERIQDPCPQHGANPMCQTIPEKKNLQMRDKTKKK